eukprot:102039_1
MMNLTLPDISSFAYSLFATLAYSGGENLALETSLNILISPYSISSALGLVLAGATPNSTCQDELNNALNVTSYLQLPLLDYEVLPSIRGDGVNFTSANGIWSRDLKTSYITTVTTEFNADAGDLPNTFDPINDYIEMKTNGMIKDMMEGELNPMTVAILVNAIHFKGDWAKQFNASKTTKEIFMTANGMEQEANFMHAERKMMVVMDTQELQGADIVKLDYGKTMDTRHSNSNNNEAEYAALFIKPKKIGRGGIHEVINSLAILGNNGIPSSSLLSIIKQMSDYREVHLSLPRFQLEYGTKSIKSPLKKLGITSVFDDEGMLMEMSTNESILLDDIFHKAVMEVTEEGTEAAAATVGIVGMTSTRPLPPIELKFDRSFIMMVLHIPSATPLFLALVDNPEFFF